MTRTEPLPCSHSPRHPPDPFQQRLLEVQRGAPPLSRLPLRERVRPQFPVRRATPAYPTASPRYRYPCGHAGLLRSSFMRAFSFVPIRRMKPTT